MKRICVLLLMIYLGVYGSQLAIWDDTKPTPLKILPFSVEIYPQRDQDALRQGIPITSPAQLDQLAEDYFS